MAWYNPTAPMGALQLALMNGRGMMPSKVQAEAPNAASRLAQAMQQGGRRITGMGERDPKSGQMVGQAGPQAPVQMQDVQSSRYMADSLLQGQDPNPQSDLSGAANVARILGSALINRRANNQEDRVQETASNERRKALELALGGQRGGSNPQAVTPSDPALQVTGKSPTGERMSDADTMRNFAMSAQTPEVQQFAMGQVQQAQARDQERATIEQEAAALGMDPRQYAVLPEATRAELFNRRFAPEPQERDIRTVGGDLVEVTPDGVNPIYRAPEEQQRPTFRPMTPDELAQYGAPEGATGQMDTATGRVYINEPATPNASQTVAAGFAARMTDAEQILTGLETDGFNPSTPGAAWTPGLLAGQDLRRYRQAQENWVRANLRRESGAVIGADEMEREIQVYFPQPGDGPEVIAQKRAAREQARRGMIGQAGRAFEQIYGDPEISTSQGGGGASGQAGGGQDADQLPDPSSLPNGTRARDNETGQMMVVQNGQWVIAQ